MAYPYPEDEREASNVFFVWEMFRPLLEGKPNKRPCSWCYSNNLTTDNGFNVEMVLFCTLNMDFNKESITITQLLKKQSCHDTCCQLRFLWQIMNIIYFTETSCLFCF